MSHKPFILSAKVVIHDEKGRCLLLKRSIYSKGSPGKWDLPGGKIDTGENLEQGLTREVAEETSLTISLQCVLGAAEAESQTRRIVYIIFKGEVKGGEVRLSSEHTDHAWVNRQDLNKFDLIKQFQPFI